MRKWLPALVLLAIASLLAGSSWFLSQDSLPERTAKLQDDWSRGVRLGIAPWNQPAAIQVAPNGERVFIAWFGAAPEGGMRPQYVQLDGQGRVLANRQIEAMAILLPKECRLILDREGHLHLFVRAIRRQEDWNGVIYYPLDAQGRLRGGPRLLSPAGQEVTSYEVALNRTGQIEVFWSQEGGLYHLGLSADGNSLSSQVLVAPLGSDPAAQVDDQGTLHLAWLRKPSTTQRELYYAAFPQGAVAPTDGLKIAEFSAAGAIVSKPVLGLDMGYVYIFWSVDKRAGPAAGTATSAYVAFPLGHPSPQGALSVDLPSLGRPVYRAYQGPFAYRQLAEVPPGSVPVGNEVLYQPAPVAGQRGELPVLFSEQVYFRLAPSIQPVLAVFAAGRLRGYQVIARSPHNCLYPQAAPDAAGNLHVVWLDQGGEGYKVFYASTMPAVKAHLDRADREDLAAAAVGLLWGIGAGLAFLPFLPLLFLAPLAWLGLYHLVGSGAGMEQPGGRRAFAVAALLYLAAKSLLFLPFFSQVPLSGPWPLAWGQVLVWALPLGIAIVAMGTAAFLTVHQESLSVLQAFLAFGLMDIGLTMAIYGPLTFGER